jgi:hypothetical protein
VINEYRLKVDAQWFRNSFQVSQHEESLMEQAWDDLSNRHLAVTTWPAITRWLNTLRIVRTVNEVK